MEFAGRGQPLTDRGIDQVCTGLGVADPELWAVLTVETRGFGFLRDRRPQILFERHIFHRRTDGRYSGSGDAVRISSKHPGGYLGGAGEYDRLAQAMRLDRQAALESASWGIGQVMGFNHKATGHTTVDDLVAAMVKNEDTQLKVMADLITAIGLAPALRRRNWAAFARGYNGAEFKRNEYDTRLAAAYARHRTVLPDLGLRTAQVSLWYLGFDPGPVDGLRGRRTRSALVEFQRLRNLPVSGELDPETEGRLLAEAFPD